MSSVCDVSLIFSNRRRGDERLEVPTVLPRFWDWQYLTGADSPLNQCLPKVNRWVKSRSGYMVSHVCYRRRMTRTMMLEVPRQDYIRTAWSKGLKERVVVMGHAFKNALIPVVTLVGLQLPIIVGGSVIMENIFNLPGLGRLMLIALNDRDYPVVYSLIRR